MYLSLFYFVFFLCVYLLCEICRWLVVCGVGSSFLVRCLVCWRQCGWRHLCFLLEVGLVFFELMGGCLVARLGWWLVLLYFGNRGSSGKLFSFLFVLLVMFFNEFGVVVVVEVDFCFWE